MWLELSPAVPWWVDALIEIGAIIGITYGVVVLFLLFWALLYQDVDFEERDQS